MPVLPQNIIERATHLRVSGSVLLVDGELTPTLRRPRWSPSSAKSLTGCPARWAAGRVLRAPDQPFDPAPLGTSVHRALEVFYGRPVGERTRETLAQIVESLDTAHAEHVTAPTDPAEVMGWRAEVLKRALPLLDVEDPATVVISSLERSLDTASIDGVPFIGFVDRTRVLLSENGIPIGIGVDDYKTSASGAKSEWAKSKYGDDHGDQLRLYALALENLDGRMPDQVRAIYTATGQVYEASLDTRSLNRVRKSFVKTWHEHQAMADAGRYPMKAGPLCGWCPLATICPAAEEIGKNEAKIEGARAGELARVVVEKAAPHTVTEKQAVPASPGKESIMAVVIESKSWEETSPDNTLNGNSYAAMAVFGLTGMAVEYLDKHGQRIGARSVTALAATFHHIVVGVQSELSGRESLQDGLNTRLRGALRTALETLPPAPFGQDEDAWEQWVTRVRARVAAQATAAINLWAHGSGSAPWTALALAQAQSA